MTDERGGISGDAVIRAITLALWGDLAQSIGRPAEDGGRMLRRERKISAGELASIATSLGVSGEYLLDLARMVTPPGEAQS